MAIYLIVSAVICVIAEDMFAIKCLHWFGARGMMKYLDIQAAVILAFWLICVGGLYIGGTLSHLTMVSTFFGAWLASLMIVWFSVLSSEWIEGWLKPKTKISYIKHELKFLKEHYPNVFHGNSRNAQRARRLHYELVKMRQDKFDKYAHSRGRHKMAQLHLDVNVLNKKRPKAHK